jgi:hypothetical protein
VYIHFSKVIHHGTSRMNILYSNLYNTPSPILYYSTKFSVYLYPSSYTDAMYFDIIYFLSFSFLSLLPLVSSNYCYYNSIYIYIHTYIYDMFVIVYMLIFWICLPYVRENMQTLTFWTWLTLLDTMIFSSIHLPTKDIISLIFMLE